MQSCNATENTKQRTVVVCFPPPPVFPSFSGEYSSFYQPMRERDTISGAERRGCSLTRWWCLCCTCIASYVTQSNVARDEFIAGMLSAAYRGKRGVTSLPFHSMRSRCLLTFLQEDEQNRKEFARRQKRKPRRNVVVTAIIHHHACAPDPPAEIQLIVF